MASVYIDLPIRSVGSISAPGLASEATQLDVLAAVTAASGTRTLVNKIYRDYSITSVTNAAYSELIASTSGTVNHLTLMDTGGYAMILAIGAAGFEVDRIYIPPGGFNGEVHFPIPSGSRISVKCLQATAGPFSGTIAEGLIVANLLG